MRNTILTITLSSLSPRERVLSKHLEDFPTGKGLQARSLEAKRLMLVGIQFDTAKPGYLVEQKNEVIVQEKTLPANQQSNVVSLKNTPYKAMSFSGNGTVKYQPNFGITKKLGSIQPVVNEVGEEQGAKGLIIQATSTEIVATEIPEVTQSHGIQESLDALFSQVANPVPQ